MTTLHLLLLLLNVQVVLVEVIVGHHVRSHWIRLSRLSHRHLVHVKVILIESHSNASFVNVVIVIVVVGIQIVIREIPPWRPSRMLWRHDG